MKKIVLVADDFGLSKGINRAIEELWKEGIVKQASIFPQANEFLDAVEIAKRNPDLELSVHLTATYNKPFTKNSNSLVGIDGFFIRDNWSNKGFSPNEDELFREFDKQMEVVIEKGLKVTAINCHHNIQVFDGIFKTFIKIAKKYNVAIRNVENIIDSKYLGDIFSMYGERRFFGNRANIKQLKNIFDEKRNNIIDIQIHPGHSDENLTSVSSYNVQRDSEYKLFKSQEFRKLLSDSNIVLTTYGECIGENNG